MLALALTASAACDLQRFAEGHCQHKITSGVNHLDPAAYAKLTLLHLGAHYVTGISDGLFSKRNEVALAAFLIGNEGAALVEIEEITAHVLLSALEPGEFRAGTYVSEFPALLDLRITRELHRGC